MKMKKRLLRVMIAVLCILSMVLPVCAEETTPRVTFENVKNTNPDLYISKEAENADDRYEMPDTRFTFTLKLNGELAKEREYRVYDEAGKEVFKYQDGESTDDKGGKLRFTTTRSGNFTLLGGQTARFEYVGSGTQYEVAESETDGWTQIRPAAGTSLRGTVAPTGSSAEFTNLYEPTVPGQDTAELKIVKNVSYPNGYELPESASFGFVLKIGGEAYANQTYTVMDNSSEEAVSTGQTDAEGRFVLPQNTTAVFAEVAADSDYEITEEETEGWRTVGERVRKGAVKAPFTSVRYTNTQASFVVSKSLMEGTSEDDFTFTLLNNKNNVWNEAQYYLYGSDGKLLSADRKQTGTDGRFQLKAGQAAVFVGIPAGTVYQVKEEPQAGYVQRIPVSEEGYTDMAVTDSVEELTFMNEALDTAGALSVLKKVQSTTGEDPLEVDEFTFILKKKDGQAPVKDAVYAVTVGDSESTFKTDEEGRFTLKANQTARFRDLEPETYVVEEVELPDEYAIEEADRIKEGTLGTEGLAFEFVNGYTPQVLSNLILHKLDENKAALADAEFGLFTTPLLTDPIGTAVSDQEGKIEFNDLRLGTYYLAETKAPEGYALLEDAIKIELKRESREEGFKLIVDGKAYGEDDTQNIWFESVDADRQDVHIRVENQRSVTVSYAFGIGEHPAVQLPADSIIAKGTTGFKPEMPKEAAGYIFKGWYYEQNCENPFDEKEAIEEDLILYGKWIPETVNVEYHWVEGTETPADAKLPKKQTVRKEQPYTAERVTTSENWIFKGWYTDPDCTTAYVDGTTLHDDLDLYGQWQKVDAVLRSADLTAYTGGTSMDKDSFPTARFLLSVNEGVDVEELTFHTSDNQTFTVSKADEGTELVIPELTENYVHNGDNADYEDDRVAGIYTIELENGPITAETADGQEIAVTYDPGQLVVRYVSNPDMAMTDLGKITTDVEYGAPSKARNTPVAYLDRDAEIATNGKESLGLLGTLDEKANIALLHDDILTGEAGGQEYKKMLTDRAMELLPPDSKASDYNFDYAYLDLINTNDGNVWVSSDKGSTIYLPYPQGTGEDTDFMLIHYKGLHREYGMGIVQDVELSVANAELENVKIEKTEYGIKFSVDKNGFSPFGLVWKKDGQEMPKPVEPPKNDGEAYTPTVNQAVKTGDTANTWIWLVGVAAALIAVGGVYMIRKKK